MADINRGEFNSNLPPMMSRIKEEASKNIGKSDREKLLAEIEEAKTEAKAEEMTDQLKDLEAPTLDYGEEVGPETGDVWIMRKHIKSLEREKDEKEKLLDASSKNVEGKEMSEKEKKIWDLMVQASDANEKLGYESRRYLAEGPNGKYFDVVDFRNLDWGTTDRTPDDWFEAFGGSEAARNMVEAKIKQFEANKKLEQELGEQNLMESKFGDLYFDILRVQNDLTDSEAKLEQLKKGATLDELIPRAEKEAQAPAPAVEAAPVPAPEVPGVEESLPAPALEKMAELTPEARGFAQELFDKIKSTDLVKGLADRFKIWREPKIDDRYKNKMASEDVRIESLELAKKNEQEKLQQIEAAAEYTGQPLAESKKTVGSEVRENLTRIDQEIVAAQGRQADLRQEKQSLNQEIGHAKDRILENLQTKIDATQTEMNSFSQELETMEARKAELWAQREGLLAAGKKLSEEFLQEKSSAKKKELQKSMNVNQELLIKADEERFKLVDKVDALKLRIQKLKSNNFDLRKQAAKISGEDLTLAKEMFEPRQPDKSSIPKHAPTGPGDIFVSDAAKVYGHRESKTQEHWEKEKQRWTGVTPMEKNVEAPAAAAEQPTTGTPGTSETSEPALASAPEKVSVVETEAAKRLAAVQEELFKLEQELNKIDRDQLDNEGRQKADVLEQKFLSLASLERKIKDFLSGESTKKLKEVQTELFDLQKKLNAIDRNQLDDSTRQEAGVMEQKYSELALEEKRLKKDIFDASGENVDYKVEISSGVAKVSEKPLAEEADSEPEPVKKPETEPVPVAVSPKKGPKPPKPPAPPAPESPVTVSPTPEATKVVQPEVETAKVAKPEIIVSDTDIQKELDNFLDSFEMLETVDREPKEGDILILDVDAYSTNLIGRKKENILGFPGSNWQMRYPKKGEESVLVDPVNNVEIQAVGRREVASIGKLKPGKKSPTWINWFGDKEANEVYTLKSVNELKKPILNDEFVKSIGNYKGIKVETVDSLKQAIKEDLKKTKI